MYISLLFIRYKMLYIVAVLFLFLNLVKGKDLADFPIINNAHDALEVLKQYSQADHKYTYEFTINSQLNAYNDTFFHEYFYYGKEKIIEVFKNDTDIDQNGFLIEITNQQPLYFDLKEIDQYGRTDFKVPYGPLRQLDEDKFDDVLIDEKLTREQKYALQILETLAVEKDFTSLRILADIYTFGFFEIKVDLEKGRKLYEEIFQTYADVKTEAHAHFMLGVYYFTGLFGKTEKDPAKGLAHYQFAADVGNVQAQMALAHKYMFGISVAEDYDMAIYYFSLINQRIENYLESYKTEFNYSMSQNDAVNIEIKKDLIMSPKFDKFNIRWGDIDGGVYGEDASQAMDTVRYFEVFKDYESIKKLYGGGFDKTEDDYEIGADETLDAYTLLYFATQKNYHGDYLHARDHDMAFKYAQTCVSNGVLEPGIKEVYKNIEELSSDSKTYSFLGNKLENSPLEIFIGRCSLYLGHMYFLGEGTDVDYVKARNYLKLGRLLSSYLTFRSDLAIMEYYGLGIEKNPEKAKILLDESINTSTARYYKSMILLDEFDKVNSASEVISNDIFSLLTSSASFNTLAKRKLIQLYEENRSYVPVSSIVGTYNSYVKLFEFLYFDFKIPFFSLLNSQVDDTKSNNMWISLVGMAIGSELGYENSQSSLGSILYPTIGDYKSRSFRNSVDVYPYVFTARRFKEAISYFELSALHANRDSINMLGDMHYNGLYSVPDVEDPLWAQKWWEYLIPVSADEKDSKELTFFIYLAESISRLISSALTPIKLKLYKYFGPAKINNVNEVVPVIPRDLAKSISYYHDSASMGSHLGSFNVGWAYEYGVGVAQDLHLAKRYYDLVLTRSDAGYIPVKFAVLRVKFKAMFWAFLGCDGRGVKELGMENRTWKQRIMMILGWVNNPE